MNGYGKNDLIRVRAALVEVATRRATITYTDLASRLGSSGITRTRTTESSSANSSARSPGRSTAEADRF